MTMNQGLQVKRMRIDKLKHDKKNARRHGPASIEALKRSLMAYGQQKAIVVTPDGKIVAGHGTATAAEQLGWTDIDVHVTQLKGAELKAFAIMDNRSAELSDWDRANLAGVVEDLRLEDFDIEDTGFALADLEDYGAPATKDLPETVTKEVTYTVGGDKPDDDREPPPAPPPPTDVVINFTAEGYSEFQNLAKYLQTELQISSLAEMLLELLRTAKSDLQGDGDAAEA